MSRHKTRRHETMRVQHDTTQDNTSATRDNASTARVQSNIKFTLIYLYHRCLSGLGILGSKALFILQNLEN